LAFARSAISGTVDGLKDGPAVMTIGESPR
jgi:hypothetical protein